MTTPTFSDDELARLIAAHGPQRPPAFAALHPHADLIRALRAKGASYETVRQILRERGVTIAETSVRNFCRRVLHEPSAEQPAPRRKGPRSSFRPAEPERAPAPDAPSPIPTASSVRPPGRGPRIAQLRRSEGEGV